MCEVLLESSLNVECKKKKKRIGFQLYDAPDDTEKFIFQMMRCETPG